MREERKLRVFKNKALMRMFGPKRDEVTREWRKIHNKQLYALYSSPNKIWVIKSRRMRLAGHVARMGDGTGIYRAMVGKPEEGDHLEYPGVDGRIILRCTFRKWDEGLGLD